MKKADKEFISAKGFKAQSFHKGNYEMFISDDTMVILHINEDGSWGSGYLNDDIALYFYADESSYDTAKDAYLAILEKAVITIPRFAK